jgi:ABC-type antimicrobial peptide transport system permease subunit
MRLRYVWYLTRKDLVAHTSRTWTSVAGIAMGVGLLSVLLSLGFGIRDTVMKTFVQDVPIDMIEAVPKSLSLGLFKINANALLGSKPLTEDTVQLFAKIPGVHKVYPILKIPVPMTARGGGVLFGKILHTDLFMTAVPDQLVAADVEESFEDAPIIPVLISPQLIDMYNTAVAPSLNTPKISIDTIRGFQFDISFGESMIFGNTGVSRTGYERARVVGSSRYAMPLGVTVPFSTGKRLLQTYAAGTSAEQAYYSSVLIQASSVEDVPSIARTVVGLGYAIDETAARTRDALTLGTFVVSLVGILVLVLASFNVSHMFYALLHEKRKEWALISAAGASPSAILTMVLMHAFVLGLAGACVGFSGARAVGWALNTWIHQRLAHVPLMPEQIFVWPSFIAWLGLCAALCAALLGALGPACRAAWTPPSKALSEV